MPIMIHGGGGGNTKEYEYVAGIDAEGKLAITVPCSFEPKAIILLPTSTSRSSVTSFEYGISLFAHFSETNLIADKGMRVSDRKWLNTELASFTESGFDEIYTVQYSSNSVTVTIIASDRAFMATFDAIVLG